MAKRIDELNKELELKGKVKWLALKLFIDE
jgi:hypothetical protein